MAWAPAPSPRLLPILTRRWPPLAEHPPPQRSLDRLSGVRPAAIVALARRLYDGSHDLRTALFDALALLFRRHSGHRTVLVRPVAPVRAQVVTLAEPVPVTDDLATVFEQGSRLESERKWAEALSFYEEHLKQYPGRTDLQQRLTWPGLHYDVARRYSDDSYIAALSALSERDTLAIYDEVLLKIQANYVHQPRWQQFVASGLTNLEVALSEPAFVERNLAADARRATGGPAAAICGSWLQPAPSPTASRRWATSQSIGSTLKQRYGLPLQAVVMEFTSGAAAALDEYSGFLTGSQMDEVFSQIEGNFVGLGIELKTEPAGLLIVNVIADGPAALGGIQAGRADRRGRSQDDCRYVARHAGRPAPRRRRQPGRGRRSKHGRPAADAAPRAAARRSAQRHRREDARCGCGNRLFQADQLPEDDQPRCRCGPVEAARPGAAAPDHRPARQPRGPLEGVGRCGRQVRDGRPDRLDPRPQCAGRLSTTAGRSRERGACRWWC